MNDIKIMGKSPKEIAEHYFSSPYVDKDKKDALIEGFIEGIEYLFPLYESEKCIADLYNKLYGGGKDDKD